MASRSDSEATIDEAGSNDSAIVDRAYRRYRESVRRYVARTFGPGPPDPDDVVQAAFERFATTDEPGAIGNAYSFLVRCCRNIVFDQRRRQKVRAGYAADVFVTESQIDELDAERVLSAKERAAIVATAIDSLDQRRREMLLMNRVEGLSYAEIARRLGVSDGLVKLRVAEALQACREAVDAREAE